MAKKQVEHRYRSTESKYKGGADEMYVTYELDQKTRGGGHALYPKVKRVYIAGKVKDWKLGEVKKRSGRGAYGVAIEYEQSRSAYSRKEYTAKRGNTSYKVPSAHVKATSHKFMKIVEVPKDAKHVYFYKGARKLPAKYRSALQAVR
jgi:hypothetical protein